MFNAADLFEKVSRGYDVKHFVLGPNKLAFRKGAKTSTGYLLAPDGVYEFTRLGLGKWEVYEFDLADGIAMFRGYFDSELASLVARFSGVVFWLNLLDTREQGAAGCLQLPTVWPSNPLSKAWGPKRNH